MDVKSKESTTAPLTMENANNGRTSPTNRLRHCSGKQSIAIGLVADTDADPPPFYYEKEIDPERLKEFDAYEILIKHSGIPEQDVLKHVTKQVRKCRYQRSRFARANIVNQFLFS